MEEKVRKVVQVKNYTYLPRQLWHTGVSPKYLSDERIEVGKGVHELAILLFAERVAEFGMKRFLHVGVAGEFDKGPLCVASNETSEWKVGREEKTYCEGS